MNLDDILNYSVGSITVGKILAAIIIFVIGYILARVLIRIIRQIIDKSKIDKTLAGFVKIVVKLVVYFVLVLIIVDFLGIPITSFIALFSVVGLAVSLAVQNALANIAGGVMLLVMKPFVVGNFVEIGSQSGTIFEIGLAYTVLNSFDNKKIYIPNSDVSSSNIVNFSANDTRMIDLSFTSSYDSPPETVLACLKEAVASLNLALPDPEPLIKLAAFQDQNIRYVVRLWTKSPDFWPTHYELLSKVKEIFDKNGIKMTDYNKLNINLIDKEI
jgi:small conductance mechanosensitive channel